MASDESQAKSRTFARFSDRLRVCVQGARDLAIAATGDLEVFENLAIFNIEMLITHLRHFDQERSVIQSFNDHLNSLAVGEQWPTVNLGNQKFLTFHESAMSLTESVVSRATTGIAGVSRWADLEESDTQVRKSIWKKNVALVWGEVSRLPEYEWEEIGIGLRRERYKFERNSPPQPSYAADAMPATKRGSDENSNEETAVSFDAPPPFDAGSRDWMLSADLGTRIGVSSKQFSEARKDAKHEAEDSEGRWGVDAFGTFRRAVDRNRVAYYLPDLSPSYKNRLVHSKKT